MPRRVESNSGWLAPAQPAAHKRVRSSRWVAWPATTVPAIAWAPCRHIGPGPRQRRGRRSVARRPRASGLLVPSVLDQERAPRRRAAPAGPPPDCRRSRTPPGRAARPGTRRRARAGRCLVTHRTSNTWWTGRWKNTRLTHRADRRGSRARSAGMMPGFGNWQPSRKSVHRGPPAPRSSRVWMSGNNGLPL